MCQTINAFKGGLVLQIIFYVPEKEAEQVKLAMFQAGAGRVGNYSHCSFESKGLGQFLPLNGAKPAIGKVGDLETVPELKVEMVCEEVLIKDVILAMKKAHPYETPAYSVIQMLNY